MNYDQIDELKEKCPKAWDSFLDYSGLRKAWHPFDDPKWYRQLYDFFDEQYIHVEVGVDVTSKAKFCSRSFIVGENGDWVTSTHPAIWSDLFYTRQEAEEEAFMKAFELLEQRS